MNNESNVRLVDLKEHFDHPDLDETPLNRTFGHVFQSEQRSEHPYKLKSGSGEDTISSSDSDSDSEHEDTTMTTLNRFSDEVIDNDSKHEDAPVNTFHRFSDEVNDSKHEDTSDDETTDDKTSSSDSDSDSDDRIDNDSKSTLRQRSSKVTYPTRTYRHMGQQRRYRQQRKELENKTNEMFMIWFLFIVALYVISRLRQTSDPSPLYDIRS